MTDISADEVLARFEELSVLEADFEDVEAELVRQSEKLNAPLYKKRAAVIAKIPHFWALVFEQSPPEIDSFLQPSDSKLFAECLETLEVSRFEAHDPKGSPRSVSIKFGFSDNDYFENKTLEKKFWYRRSLDGWAGLVSEPVKINWKKGKDATRGLTDMAVALHQARAKLSKSANGTATAPETELPEYKALAAKIEESEAVSQSFFLWFGFVSSYKLVTAEESEKASKIEAEKMEKRRRGETVDDEDDDDEDNQDYQETELLPEGDQIATVLAEDVWPNAIRYFKASHEDGDDEELSDLEVEGIDFDEDDSDDEIDIRGLVGKGKKPSSGSPPPKKQRKA